MRQTHKKKFGLISVSFLFLFSVLVDWQLRLAQVVLSLWQHFTCFGFFLWLGFTVSWTIWYSISFTSFGAFKYKPQDEFGHLKLRQCLMARWMSAGCSWLVAGGCSAEWMFALSLTIVVIVSVLACFVFFCGAFTNSNSSSRKNNNRSFVFDPFNGPVHIGSPSIGYWIGIVRDLTGAQLTLNILKKLSFSFI